MIDVAALRQTLRFDDQNAAIAPICFVLTLIVQFALTYTSLLPQIGFDDANITQVYARHLAEGHGFVYNMGGERVEGSTSFLWTVINAAMFLTPYPIFMITALSILLTSGTLALAGAITRTIGGSNRAVACTYLLFNLMPGFFAWMMWSLMDITLWVFTISAVVWSVFRLETRDDDPFANTVLILGAICLPLIRPEGIALTLALFFFLTCVRAAHSRPFSKFALAGLLSVSSIAVLTLWRLSYFGYPVPNTFYAKTSSDLPGQIGQGLEYTGSFLSEFATLAIILLWIFGLMTSRRQLKASVRGLYWMIVAYLFLGGLIVYTVLGGDHFGSYRFFLYNYPLLLPLAAIAILDISTRLTGVFVRWALAAIVALCAFQVMVDFVDEGGDVRHEFRIAESNLRAGTALSRLPGLPTLATIPAGGIKIGYPGVVYDVLGLNWTTMAHAAETKTDATKNHGSFDAQVFWDAQPELAFARLGSCRDEVGYVTDEFRNLVTDRIVQTERFAAQYVAMCSDEVVLYAAREIEMYLRNEGFENYMQ